MEPTAPPTAAADAPPAAESGPNPEKVKASVELLQGILQRMGVTAEVAVREQPDGIHLAITPSVGGEALGGGRRSGVMESVAYLLNKAINREEAGRKWVFLELVGDFAGAPEPGEPASAPSAAAAPPANIPVDPALLAIAEELVAKARKVGGVVWVGAQAPAARTALQQALGKVAGVKVKVEGEGLHRRLVVEAS